MSCAANSLRASSPPMTMRLGSARAWLRLSRGVRGARNRKMNTVLDQTAVLGGDAASGEDRSCDEEPPSRLRLALERVDDDGDWAAFGPVDDMIAAVGRVLAEAPEFGRAPIGFFPATAAVALSS